MPTTLKDVAVRAGVSAKTVSNVVHGQMARVSPGTAERVRAALTDLNYRPNVAARALRQGRVRVLAMVVPDLTNPYFTSLCTEVISAAAEHGYTVLIDHTAGDWAQESLALNGLRPHLVDGVILSPVSLQAADLELRSADLPFVLLGERLYDVPCDHVAIDNVAAARQATEHLLTLGRRRIAAIGGPAGPSDDVLLLRLRGYQEALNEAGLPPDPELVVPMDVPDGGPMRAAGAIAMERLLLLDRLPDAVFCFNDLLALGAMTTLLLNRVRIPDDIALMGFDNTEEGRFAVPSLSTVAPDKREIARSAVALLLQRIDARAGSPRFVQPSFRLVVRASTAGEDASQAITATR
ncbi:MAG TPA: LacI family DNA-binding transcriptional regulator [Chloroflexota bacterium]|nr:LacI family DNA-binding transcriptional regulator [Chloroflexota bacterium]